MHLNKIVYDKWLYIFRTIFESTVNSKWFEVDYQQRNEDVGQWGVGNREVAENDKIKIVPD